MNFINKKFYVKDDYLFYYSTRCFAYSKGMNFAYAIYA